MNNPWNSLTNTSKGIIFIVAGSILFIYTTGLVQKGLTLLIMAAALGMIALGIMQADYHTKIYQWLKKH